MSHPRPPEVAELRREHVADAASLVASEPNFAAYGLRAGPLAASLHAAIARGETLLTLRDDAQLVGLAWLVPNGAFARSPYLRLIAVARAVQGRGVGGRLLAAVEDAAWRCSDDLFLLVTASNADARRFYLRCGFVEIGTLHDYVVPGVDEVLMRKRRQALAP